MTAQVLLEVEGLRTELTSANGIVHAVDGVSFQVAMGETLGVVGESGCGKSMTAYSIMGLLPPGGRIVAGAVRLDGIDLTKLSPAAMRDVRGNQIGMVFQDPMSALNPTMTIGDQIAEPLRLHRPELSKAERAARVLDTMHLVGIPAAQSRISAYPHQLSGGLRQRVAIAIALVCQPKLLIADEPTTALDVTIQRQILDLIDRLRSELDMAVILVTHDLGVIAGHTDRVAVMYGGEIVESATTADIFASPRHRYTEGLFEALPERAADQDVRLVPIPGSTPDLSDKFVGCRFADRCSFVTDECRSELLAVVGVGPGHTHRCAHPVGSDATPTRTATSGNGTGPEPTRPRRRPQRAARRAHQRGQGLPRGERRPPAPHGTPQRRRRRQLHDAAR